MHVLLYIPWLIKEIFHAGATVAVGALRRDGGFHPIVLRYPLRVTSDWHLFWFSTSITATPGTLSLGFRELPDATRVLLVHATDGRNPAEVFASLADMEERLAPHVKGLPRPTPEEGSVAPIPYTEPHSQEVSR